MESASQTELARAVAPDPQIPFLDIVNPAFDPEHQSVADAREQSWYAQTPMGPMVLRHEEAWRVLRDRRFVPGGRRYMHAVGITEGPVYDWFVNMLASLPTEDHTRLRPLVNKAFSPRMVENLRPVVRQIAERLADDVAGSADGCDFVHAFAEPLPALVMCEMLGVPAEDYHEFHGWANDIGLVFNTRTELPRSEAAVVGLSDYVTSLVARRRAEPGDDLISTLIAAEEAGNRLTPDELHNLLVLLVWAAQDTTARQLGRAIVAFSEHPEQWELLAQHGHLASQAVEEICRFSPQARLTFRFATEDVQLDGLAIPAETMVLVSIVAGNRDPRAYDDPERLDIAATRENRQLVFGGGAHTCLGAGAARLELAEGIAALARRLGPPSVTGPIEWSPPTAMINGPHRLPVRFSARG